MYALRALVAEREKKNGRKKSSWLVIVQPVTISAPPLVGFVPQYQYNVLPNDPWTITPPLHHSQCCQQPESEAQSDKTGRIKFILA